MRERANDSRLRLTDTVTEAISAIAQRPARTLLTALGTILGVGAFVTTTGLADTARAQVSARFDALKATEVRIQDVSPDGTNPFPNDVDARLEALNGVIHAGLIYSVSGNLDPRSTATQPTPDGAVIPVIAATPGGVLAVLPTLATGRVYDSFHEARAERVALVGRIAARELGISRVDHQPAVFLGNIGYTVVGIIDDVSRNPNMLLAVIIPTSAEQHDFSSPNAEYEVLIDTQPGGAGLAGRQAPLALRPQEPERLQALIPPDPDTLRNNVESDVTALYYALAALAVFIGTVAIANATLLNTIERRPEIGLRRALGATRPHISRQITLEAAITGTLAGIAGTALAVLSVVAVAGMRGWTATLDPRIIALAPLIGLITGAAAGIVPARRAARTPPAITLRSSAG